MTEKVSVFVPGVPAPQGSKDAFVNKKTGKAQVVEASAEARPWRGEIKMCALDARNAAGARCIDSGAVGVRMVFVYDRPKAHRKANLKATRPDIDKLERNVLDALTGIAFKDDGQVAQSMKVKRYQRDGETPGLQLEWWLAE